ncbi:MAG: RHS repeat-associated core domain-containing protein [Candidatus Competibacteraceae bacterium]|nr:RHS repeat-associated core domain-containing protein [Candidatus Competibacteraceae bacterium]
MSHSQSRQRCSTVTTSNTFHAWTNLNTGSNVISIVATDPSENIRTNRYGVAIASAAADSFSYDKNGNLTNAVVGGVTKSFEWDAANRLLAVVKGTERSEFSYNGKSQRVKIIEKVSGVAQSTNTYLWCGGTQPCQERSDNGSTVRKRFFEHGEQWVTGANAGKYEYVRDHLGTVRNLVSYSGAETITTYSYDPYGRRTRISGTLDATFGFTGHFFHQKSGLHLAWYRAYDADLGRWLSRDPIAESGGNNLYQYVRATPVLMIDPLGLVCECSSELAAANAASAALATAQAAVKSTALSYSTALGFQTSACGAMVVACSWAASCVAGTIWWGGTGGCGTLLTGCVTAIAACGAATYNASNAQANFQAAKAARDAAMTAAHNAWALYYICLERCKDCPD